MDSYVYLGSVYDDHYCIKVSTDGGNEWTLLWDATAQTGGWNYYASPIVVDLNNYSGQQIKLAWQANDPPSDNGLWYPWFIDNIHIGNDTTSIRFHGSDLLSRSQELFREASISAPRITATALSRAAALGYLKSEPSLPVAPEVPSPSTRSLQGYNVWRLQAGNENNPDTWVPLNTALVSNLTLTDTAWNTLANGSYRWAVKAVYTANISSVPSFSNILLKQTLVGNIVGFVRRANGNPIVGATVSTGNFSATTNSVGAYSLMNLPVGTYSVTAVADGFQGVTHDNIVVSPNQNTTLNIVLEPVSNEDPLAPVVATVLTGNYPNPFNPETTIRFSIKDAVPVRLEVYNLKGQMVRSLVNGEMKTGHYQVVFNGQDSTGRPLASGIYLYRLTADTYSSTRKMMLME